MNNQITQGLLIAGVLRGFRPRMYNNQVQGYELGIAIEKPDGFGGMAEELKIVRVNDSQQISVQNAANRCTGKTVLISVYESAYAGKKGAIAQLNFVPDSVIIDLDSGVNPFTGELNKTTPKVA
jgi:hypothetical protein